MPHSARLDRSGRLVLPAAIRGELELREGDEVLFLSGASPGEVRLLSRRAAPRQGQSIVRKYIPAGEDLVGELIRNRRRDAAAENPRARAKRQR